MLDPDSEGFDPLPCAASFLDPRYRDALNTKLKDAAQTFIYNLLTHQYTVIHVPEHEEEEAASQPEPDQDNSSQEPGEYRYGCGCLIPWTAYPLRVI